MDVTIIADTHGLQDEIKLKTGTMLIHAGDVTEYGSEEEVIDFLEWFAKQPFKYKIFIAGNHDVFFEECTAAKRKKIIPKDIIYLQNSGVEIEGLKIWGSPVTPYFLGMAFNARNGKDIKKIWNKVPIDTDILITHGPPKGMLDNDFGCEELLNRVNIVRPKIHCFGHVHGRNGMANLNQTRFINATLVNSSDPMDIAFIIIDREKDGRSPVSALLNISDGLLSDCLNIQVICSFNTDISKIDSALMRKGRLIAKYEFKELATEKAQALSDKLSFNTTICKPMTLTEIYNQNEPGFEYKKQRNPIGFSSRNN